MGGFHLVGSTAGGIEGRAGGFMDRSGRQGRAMGSGRTGEPALVNGDPDEAGPGSPREWVWLAAEKARPPESHNKRRS